MSQNDGFGSGFFAGAIVGGLVGGLLGVLASSRLNKEKDEEPPFLKSGKSEAKLGTEESIEGARRSLEDKIAQLNLAIDDVRHQLGEVNGTALEQEQHQELD